MTVPTSSQPRLDQLLNVIVATDCGSTTTKAILIEKIGSEYRQTFRGEAPTTVEAPFEDVTRGVLNAIAEIEELSGRKILDGDRIITPCQDAKTGVDIYISTSSAGGGLQMMVTGVVQNMTGESAQRAALVRCRRVPAPCPAPPQPGRGHRRAGGEGHGRRRQGDRRGVQDRGAAN